MVFIIGLPKPIKARIEAEARQNGMRLTSILCDVGKEGTLMLLPHPSQAFFSLKGYYKELADIDDANIIVLPYAPIPKDLEEELDLLDDMGDGTISKPIQGQNGWVINGAKRPDTAVLNAIYERLLLELFPGNNLVPAPEVLPSEYFRAASEAIPQLIFAENVFDACDQVAKHRHSFMKNAADAFSKMVKESGQVGPVDNFFAKLGLDHAQTGGIQTTLQVNNGASNIYHKTSSVHLKRGDKTTPQAAPRIYYHNFLHGERYYVVVLYAGPHPEVDVSRILELD